MPPKRTSGRAVIVLGVVVGLVALVVGVYMLTLGRSPLAGPSTHDFGFVTIDGAGGSAEHTFTLTNRTSQSLQLGTPRSTCGCTVSELSTDILEPGEEVTVTAELTLRRAGRRSSEIVIPMEGRGVHTLRITGVGRTKNEIHSRRADVLLRPDHDAFLGFSVDAWPDAWDDVTDLPEPSIETPDGVKAELVSWRLTQGPEGDSPAFWQGRITLGLADEATELPEDAMLIVATRDSQELRVPLRRSVSRD